MRKLFALLLVFFASSFSLAETTNPHPGTGTKPPSADLAKIEKLLGSTGLEGLMHGALHDQNMYVITLREPGQIVGIEFPVITRDATVREQLKKLRRNDQVRLFGKLLGNGAAQEHILVTKLELMKPWNPGAEPPVVRPDAEIPKDLLKQTELLGKVHVSAAEGRVLVVDYRGAIFPVINAKPELAKGLWPNDKIRLRYVVETSPGRPSHLALDVKAKDPLQVLASTKDQIGKEYTLTGTLVLFPKSVLTTMEVFAVETVDSDGIKQYYFIFTHDMDVLKASYAKLRKIWDSETKGRVTYRTRYLNPNLKVEVKGEVFSSKLAGNPQILIDSANAVVQK